jgi:hypothetical protein
MELPDDVLAIVRDYSRPVFKHYQVYNTALKVLGVYGGWDTLKEKLEAETEGVIPALLVYQNSFLERKKTEKEYSDFMLEIYINHGIPIPVEFKMDEQERLSKRVRISRRIEDFSFEFLRSILYPDP